MIYCLVSEDEPNNIKYVGITRRKPEYRLSNHIYEAKKEPNKNKRSKWISENNFKIKQIILDIVDENPIFWEQYWISQIKTWGFDLVNSNKGGGGLNKRSIEFSKWLSNRNIGNKYNLGKTHSLNAKDKMSKAKIGKESPRKGAIISDETKLKQSLSKLGKKSNASGFKHSEETKMKKRKKLLQFNLNGDLIKEWDSVTEVANHFNVGISTISNVLKKENKKYKNFIFKIKT
jgi:group I intron endonuclease